VEWDTGKNTVDMEVEVEDTEEAMEVDTVVELVATVVWEVDITEDQWEVVITVDLLVEWEVDTTVVPREE
jgi:hypothetical protein